MSIEKLTSSFYAKQAQPSISCQQLEGNNVRWHESPSGGTKWVRQCDEWDVTRDNKEPMDHPLVKNVSETHYTI